VPSKRRRGKLSQWSLTREPQVRGGKDRKPVEKITYSEIVKEGIKSDQTGKEAKIHGQIREDHQFLNARVDKWGGMILRLYRSFKGGKKTDVRS